MFFEPHIPSVLCMPGFSTRFLFKPSYHQAMIILAWFFKDVESWLHSAVSELLLMYIKLFGQCEPSSLGGRVLGTTKKMLLILRLGIPKRVKIWFS